MNPSAQFGDTSWFTHDRFGLFIHWGLYALAARHEWVKSVERIDNDSYQKYFDHFDPDLYDPEAWASAASDAGMKYFVATTKHHEGFCLWDSDLTDYKATNTPIARDLLKPMVQAFRDRNMRVGFYHSLLDWRHPDYTLDQHHPQRDDAGYAEADNARKLGNYAKYLHGQTEELLTRFGQVDVLWYDFSVGANERFPGKGKDVWQSEQLLKTVRSLQPKILVNDRLEIDQDIRTPEQVQPRAGLRVNGVPVVWEACQTFSGSWGYHRDEASWKSVEMLVQMLVDTVSKNGNLLLNVGPTGRGEFDRRALDRLSGIGTWMKRHSRSIYGCGEAPPEFATPQDCRLTYNSATRRLYVHLFAWPFGHLHLDGFAGKVAYAQLLNDASEIRWTEGVKVTHFGEETEDIRSKKGTISLELPIQKPDATVPVIELFLR